MPPIQIPDTRGVAAMQMPLRETGPIVRAGAQEARGVTIAPAAAGDPMRAPPAPPVAIKAAPIVATAVVPIQAEVEAVPVGLTPPEDRTVAAVEEPTEVRDQAAEVEAATAAPDDLPALREVTEAVEAEVVAPQVVSEVVEAEAVLPECVPAEAVAEAEEAAEVAEVAADVLNYQYPNCLNSKS